MASGSSHSQSSVGGRSATSTNEEVVAIVPTNRNPAIWQYFDLCQMSTGIRKGRCKRCGMFFKEEGNSTLKNHANIYCKALKNQAGQNQPTMTNQGNIWTYEQEKVREAMAKFVIQESLPFNHFDNPRLTKLIQDTLQPRYCHVSRSTLRRDCINMWRIAKNEMIEGFEKLECAINLTCDIWTAPHGSPDSFLCVTAHWVDPTSWQMMKRTITFELFGYPHTGDNLFKILDATIKTYKMENKVFSISFDNASNNTVAVGQLKIKYKPVCEGVFFHSRCVAHIINLVVQDGLKQIADVREQFRQMLIDIYSSSNARYHKYMKFCNDAGANWLGPNWDVSHRWNSTCNMYECALRQKETLTVFHDMLAERNRVVKYPEASWQIVKQVTELLAVFKNATTFLSGVYYPTSPLVLNQIYLMCSALSNFELRSDLFRNMIQPMKTKFKKYFKEMPPVISCAAALNPTINVGGVETLLESIAYDLDLIEENANFAIEAKSKFNNVFSSLFEVYLSKYGSTPIHDTMRNAESSSRGGSESIRLYNTLRNEASKRARGSTPSSELGRYIGTDFLAHMSIEDFENLDILAWWKEKESQFPILAAMARDLLTVQASTVASESAFSVSGRVISPRRTKLTPISVEVCICLKDYLDGVERIQHISPLEGKLEDVEERIHEEEIMMGLSIPLTAEELQYEALLQNNLAMNDD